MDSTNRENKLRPDSPLESSDQDRLGYADFAEQLAQTVVSRTHSNGYTIGIYGPWGSGKSTILNFVDDQLGSSDSSPAVVRFNPWWFSGQADLIEKFLTQLGATLESEDQFPDIRPQLAKMSSTLSKVPFEPFTGIPIGQGFGALEAFLQQEGKGIGELKQEISDELEELDQKTIIIIDDIDRLTPGEISQMFQIIKSIADFPNVVYILAFDHTIVVDALEKEENIRDGEQYLQKIIQLPLHIPTHKQGALESLFLDQLAEIPGDYTVESERWDPLLRKGVMPILQTPREVIRLANTIDVMCVSVGDEVDFVDLVGLETLRVFHSDVYDEIKSSPERFVGHRSLHARSSDEPDDYGDILGKNIDDDEEREAVESILKQLFPFVKDNLADQTSSYSNWNKMRVEKRICHRDRFPIYFRLNIPEGEVSDAEMGAIMSVMDNSELLTEELEELLQEGGREESSKAATFIHRLDDRIDNIDPENVTPIVKSIFAIGDRLIQQEQLHAQHREMRSVIFVLKSLLKIQDETDRVNTLKTAIAEGDSPYLSSRVLEVFLRDHGEYGAEPSPEEERLFELHEIDELKPAVVESIEEAADNEELIEVPWLKRLLEQWTEWSESNKPQRWVEEITETEEGLLQFIDSMSDTSTLNMTTPVPYLDPRWIDDYLDRSEVEERLDSLDETDLDEDQQEVIERFDRAIEMLEADKDPSTVENWIMGW